MNKKFAVLGLLGAGAIVGGLLSLPATEVIRWTSSNEFCASCHTMEPMVTTFAHSVHGGNNKSGFVADCVSCHIPKSNIVEELYVKGTAGVRHLWGEFVVGKEMLDYDKLHNMRTEIVYDSGCLKCHVETKPRAMAAATQENPSPADWTHLQSFNNKQDDSDWNCASCHYDVAHPNLKWEMKDLQYDKLRKESAPLFEEVK